MRLEVHATAQGHPGCQYVQHGELNNPRGHRHIDVGVLRQWDVQAQGAGLGQGRAGGGQAEHRGAVLPGQTRDFHQFAGAASVGNDHEEVAGVGHRSQHALHQHIGMRGYREVEAEEFVLGIQGHRGRGAEAKEVDLPGLDQQVNGAADQLRVEALAGAVEGGDGTAEDLPGIGLGAVVGFHRAAHVGGAAGQALGQLHFQFWVAVDAERAAEAIDCRLADLRGLGQRGNAEAGGFLRAAQNHFGNLAFGLAQPFEAVLDLLQKISHAVHLSSLGRGAAYRTEGARLRPHEYKPCGNIVIITT